MKKNIFIVEDEPAIQEMLTMFLGSEGFAVKSAYDVDEAKQYLTSNTPDLILLDWMLPKGSGIQLLNEIRNNENNLIKNIPVIMLTAKTELNDKILGLNTGADDYISKPFSLKELLARIQTNLRRSEVNSKTESQTNHIKVDSLLIDLDAHRLFVDQQLITIGRMEFKLLCFLIEHIERVYSRGQLLDYVWGSDNFIDERTVDVSIGRLRKTLEPFGYDQKIQTVRGEGYRFSKL